jgi:hypothetical protein
VTEELSASEIVTADVVAPEPAEIHVSADDESPEWLKGQDLSTLTLEDFYE